MYFRLLVLGCVNAARRHNSENYDAAKASPDMIPIHERLRFGCLEILERGEESNLKLCTSAA